MVWCRSTNDDDCLTLPNGTAARTVLPICASATSENCVEDLSFAMNDGDFKSAKFSREIGGYTIPGDENLNLIEGRSASIWNSSSVVHKGNSSNYLMSPVIDWTLTNGKFVPASLRVNVIPFTEKSGKFTADRFLTDSELDSIWRTDSQWSGYLKKNIPKVRQSGLRDRSCFVYDNGYCLISQDFSDKTKVKVSLRVTNEIGGWFRGRMSSPEISTFAFFAISFSSIYLLMTRVIAARNPVR